MKIRKQVNMNGVSVAYAANNTIVKLTADTDETKADFLKLIQGLKHGQVFNLIIVNKKTEVSLKVNNLFFDNLILENTDFDVYGYLIMYFEAKNLITGLQTNEWRDTNKVKVYMELVNG